MLQRPIVLTIAGLIVILSASGAATAQTFTGSVFGRIVDSQQKAAAGAVVTLRSLEREYERHTTANAQGEYLFDLVPPGQFAVIAELAGFAATEVRVEVVVATPVRANMIVHVESAREEVRVLGEGGVSVQAENAELGALSRPMK